MTNNHPFITLNQVNIQLRIKRNQKIIKYLTTAQGRHENGNPVYPTLFMTAVHFNLSVNQISLIKNKAKREGWYNQDASTTQPAD